MKLEREIMLDRTDINMIMLICGFTLEEKKIQSLENCCIGSSQIGD